MGSLMRSKCSSDQESASNSVYSNTNGSPSANSTLTMSTPHSRAAGCVSRATLRPTAPPPSIGRLYYLSLGSQRFAIDFDPRIEPVGRALAHAAWAELWALPNGLETRGGNGG